MWSLRGLASQLAKRPRLDQTITPPGPRDTDSIARQLVYAHQLVEAASGVVPGGGLEDLALLQATLADIGADRTYDLQSLGLVLGQVFLHAHSGFDWWMVEDEYGRDPALRYKETSLLLFPLTMLSKRIEDGEELDLVELFHGLSERVSEIIDQHYS